MNAFQILGISSADSNVVKAAYRRLCQINHPDRCKAPGATEALAAINVAYQWITKGGRRAPDFSPTLIIFRSVEECAAAAEAEAIKAAEAEAAAKAAAEATKAAPKKARASTKTRGPKLIDQLREALERGETIYAEDYPSNTPKTFIGAIRALRNATYAGPLGPMNLRHNGMGGWYKV